MSVFRTSNDGSHRTEFFFFSNFVVRILLLNCVDTFRFWLNCDNSHSHFTLRQATYVYDLSPLLGLIIETVFSVSYELGLKKRLSIRHDWRLRDSFILQSLNTRGSVLECEVTPPPCVLHEGRWCWEQLDVFRTPRHGLQLNCLVRATNSIMVTIYAVNATATEAKLSCEACL